MLNSWAGHTSSFSELGACQPAAPLQSSPENPRSVQISIGRGDLLKPGTGVQELVLFSGLSLLVGWLQTNDFFTSCLFSK